MSLKEEITTGVKQAMKAGEKVRLQTLRFLLSAVKNKEIDKRAELSEAEILQVISTSVKQHKDSIEQFRKGGRVDLASKEEAELEVLTGFLPPQLSEDEIKDVVASTATELGAETMKDMGGLMKAVMARLKGRADGKLVQAAVKQRLAGQ
ncbi:Transamidase GatB domain protein [hydrothermal vent metagenome]|uniref:Transamidase GatB domain protein n=1 Tax=hydrothermal vent metagenome TaxID=652676 RepID=A0A3B0UWA8_9ZZZZ